MRVVCSDRPGTLEIGPRSLIKVLAAAISVVVVALGIALRSFVRLLRDMRSDLLAGATVLALALPDVRLISST